MKRTRRLLFLILAVAGWGVGVYGADASLDRKAHSAISLMAELRTSRDGERLLAELSDSLAVASLTSALSNIPAFQSGSPRDMAYSLLIRRNGVQFDMGIRQLAQGLGIPEVRNRCASALLKLTPERGQSVVSEIQSNLLIANLNTNFEDQLLEVVIHLGPSAKNLAPILESLAGDPGSLAGIRRDAAAALVKVAGMGDFLSWARGGDTISVQSALAGLHFLGGIDRGSWSASETEKIELGQWILGLMSSPVSAVRLYAVSYGSQIITSQWYYCNNTVDGSHAADSVLSLLTRMRMSENVSEIRDSVAQILPFTEKVLLAIRAKSSHK